MLYPTRGPLKKFWLFFVIQIITPKLTVMFNNIIKQNIK
ncbi:hypothetical protein TSIB_1260 [Thermococcus sibiricus MM 739]|uniref:Uncharacterized protein n=1 Tax=Thermococcus sibiricus (strain DSM 12597 / MM 739) TaxID=604354 RepID=C6A3W9_THESM|nr:hypothetical protein TSIB_1260 [Thermococcus sibiricus MM 739]